MWFLNYGYFLIIIIAVTEVVAKIYPVLPKSNQNIAKNKYVVRAKRQFGFQDSYDDSPDYDGFDQNSQNNDFFNNGNAIFFDEENRFRDFVPGSNQDSGSSNRQLTTRRPLVVTPPVNIPGMGTTRSSCEDQCLTTSQYNPVCGDNRVTYINIERFNCAVRCGRNVQVAAYRACPRIMV